MNKQEFGNLVMESERLLYRVAKSILYDDNDCADAIGEAVTNAFEKLHTLKKDEYARTWLVIVLYYLEGYSMREIAQILRIRESAVRKRMERARNELKEFLREDGHLWTSLV